MLSKPWLSRILVAVMVAGFTAAVFAASPKYKRGGQPVCTIDQSDGSAECTSGLVTGLGNGDIVVVATVTSSAGTLCTNPSGKTQPGGQNPAEGSGEGGAEIDDGAIKNGNATIPAISTAPVQYAPVTVETADCPGANWTASVDTENATYSGFYSFSQGGTEISSLSFSFD